MQTHEQKAYCDQMEEIKRRTVSINEFISGRRHTGFEATNVEFCCLQIRQILEKIAMSTLVANKRKYSSTYENFSKHWNARLLLRDVEKLNPDFYPRPVIEIPDPTPDIKTNLKERPKDYLEKEEFLKVYELCGSILHAENPFGKKKNYDRYKNQISIWRQKIINLLNSHQIKVVDHEGFFLVHMKEDRDDKVHCYEFIPKDEIAP